MPSDTDATNAEIGLALIPSHITRDGSDDAPEDEKPWPWARLDIADVTDYAAAVITPDQARALAYQLTEWADQVTEAEVPDVDA